MKKRRGFLDQKVYLDFSDKVHNIKNKMRRLFKDLKEKIKKYMHLVHQ